jgi:glycosyltransferase involved in cell wall biosynthesis
LAVNSEFVRRRVQQAWNCDSRVIYPPVDIEGIQAIKDWSAVLQPQERQVLDSLPSGFLLGASRFVSYKKLDVVIRLGQRLSLPVVIAGQGPEKQRLAIAASTVHTPVIFVDAPSNALLRALFQRCLVYIFPAVEDFGIMPVEAMACGAAVIVGDLGGAKESVQACGRGVSVPDWSEASVRTALETIASTHRTDTPEAIQYFSRSRFIRQLKEWMTECI